MPHCVTVTVSLTNLSQGHDRNSYAKLYSGLFPLLFIYVRLSSTQLASVWRNLAPSFLLDGVSLFIGGTGEREMREVRKNKASTLLGSLNFTLFYIRGHQVGPSVLFLKDIKLRRKHSSFLIVAARVRQEHLWQAVEKSGLDMEAQAVSR